MRVAVLLTYYGNVRDQLARSLWLLDHQTYPIDELWILDDGGEPIDESWVERRYSGEAYLCHLRKYGSSDRSANNALNYGYAYCQGDYIITTMAEIMVPIYAVDNLLSGDTEIRQVPTCFSIDWPMHLRLDQVNWREHIEAIQTLPNFWSTRTPWLYTNEDARGYHNHISFCGQSRRAWDLTNFIPHSTERGMNDCWLHKMELLLERPAVDAGFDVYHQWHSRPNDLIGVSMRIKHIMENAQ